MSSKRRRKLERRARRKPKQARRQADIDRRQRGSDLARAFDLLVWSKHPFGGTEITARVHTMRLTVDYDLHQDAWIWKVERELGSGAPRFFLGASCSSLEEGKRMAFEAAWRGR